MKIKFFSIFIITGLCVTTGVFIFISFNKSKNSVLPQNLDDNVKGRVVCQSNQSGHNQICLIENGGAIKNLTSGQFDNSYPGWSPDGNYIVFKSDRDGNDEIYIMDKHGNNQKRLTNHPGRDISPSWFSDGERIIFVSDRDGVMNFYSIRKDGSDINKITDFKQGVNDMPRVSPDAKKILFTSNKGIGWQVFLFDIDKIQETQITSVPFGHCEPRWSHDGEKITFVKRLGSGDSFICIMDKDGNNRKELSGQEALNYNPQFSPKDDKIIFSSNRTGNWELYVLDINMEILTRITNTATQEQWPDWID